MSSLTAWSVFLSKDSAQNVLCCSAAVCDEISGEFEGGKTSLLEPLQLGMGHGRGAAGDNQDAPEDALPLRASFNKSLFFGSIFSNALLKSLTASLKLPL